MEYVVNYVIFISMHIYYLLCFIYSPKDHIYKKKIELRKEELEKKNYVFCHYYQYLSRYIGIYNELIVIVIWIFIRKFFVIRIIIISIGILIHIHVIIRKRI